MTAVVKVMCGLQPVQADCLVAMGVHLGKRLIYLWHLESVKIRSEKKVHWQQWGLGVYNGGLQPETLADGNNEHTIRFFFIGYSGI
eukprot:1138028-Pelagomonas_calceolata.AAC.2